MCGIAGFFGARPIDDVTLQAMADGLASRGPDAGHVQGWNQNWQSQPLQPVNGFVHARLSIRDLSSRADQPMTNEDQSVWICYNGEVYGYEDSKRELEQRGFSFKTTSDTEFILRAYEAWGIDMLRHLRGMFAIAVLDLRRNCCYLIRDRIGKKPLLYYHQGGELAFASVVRALVPYLPKEQARVSAAGVDAFLAHRYIPAPLSILDGIQRLENGHYLHFNFASRSLSKHCYWQPEPLQGDYSEVLAQAIAMRTVSDRPVGLFLSGGVDSTLLASSLRHQGFENLQAFTARFSGSTMDESETAARTAKLFGLSHTIVDVPQHIDNDAFARIVGDLDDPFADPSSFPMWYLARETTRHVKVVFGGDGGDELYAGYKRYSKHVRSGWRRHFRLHGSPFREGSGKLSKLISELQVPWEEAYSLRFSGLSFQQRKQLQPSAHLNPVHWRMELQKLRALSPLDSLLQIDMDNYLPEYILRKGDLCTMAHGLELRCPLLDHIFFQTVLGMPRQQRFTSPAKQALKPLVGEATHVFEQKKRGFNPPLTLWLKECWNERYQGLGARLAEHTNGQLDSKAVDRFVTTYLLGQDKLAEQVLQLLILDESLRQLLGSKS